MRILAELERRDQWAGWGEDPKTQLLTTGDVAKQLERSPRGVRWLAQVRRIQGVHTRSGQWLFRPEEITRVMQERADARLWSRQERLRAVRLRMVKAGFAPRQLDLFRGREKSERSLPDLAVKRPTLVRKSA